MNLSLLHCQWMLYHWAILTTMPQDIIKMAHVKERILKAARAKTRPRADCGSDHELACDSQSWKAEGNLGPRDQHPPPNCEQAPSC